MTPRDVLFPLVLASSWTGGCEQTRDEPVTPVAPVVQETPKEEPQTPDEAREEVRTLLAKTFNMSDAKRAALAIRVMEEWAVAKDESGLMFLCKRHGGTWGLLASGTTLDAPPDAPLGLIPKP